MMPTVSAAVAVRLRPLARRSATLSDATFGSPSERTLVHKLAQRLEAEPQNLALFRTRVWSRGTWLVLAASSCVWSFWQLSPDRANFPWPIADNTAFPFAAWQVYFFTALVIGFHRRSIAQRIAALRPALSMVGSGVLAAGLVRLHQFLSSAPADGAQTEFTWSVAELFYKYDVRLGRIVAALVFTTVGYSLLTLAWRPIRRGLGSLLLPLGQHALTAYALHLFLCQWRRLLGGPSGPTV